MAKTCDGETYVYVKPGVDQDEIRRAIAGVKGIEKIYDGAQAVKLGADPHCAFLVEAKAGYYFTDESQRPAVVEPALSPASNDGSARSLPWRSWLWC